MVETERQLLEAIHGGERAALRRLYDRYADYAMAIGLRYIPERDAVRDVLQDSFVKILTAIPQFRYRGEGSLKAWVSRVVSNRAVDYLREHQRFAFIDSFDDFAVDASDGSVYAGSDSSVLDGSVFVGSDSSVLDGSDGSVLDGFPVEMSDSVPADVPSEALMAMIGRLPANYRTVLNLFVFEECSHREIAQQLGIKESTSASLFFRAKKMLARMIKEYTNNNK